MYVLLDINMANRANIVHKIETSSNAKLKSCDCQICTHRAYIGISLVLSIYILYISYFQNMIYINNTTVKTPWDRLQKKYKNIYTGPTHIYTV